MSRTVALTILLLACSPFLDAQEKSSPADTPKVLFPLNVGIAWTYQYAADSGVVRPDNSEESVAKVVEQKMMEGKMWYKYHEFEIDYWIRNGEDGQYELVFDEGEDKSDSKLVGPYLYFRYPVREVPATDKQPWTHVTVVDTEAKVKTAAGLFTCYLYRLESTEDDFVAEYWIAPGVGMVKFMSEVDGQREAAELQSYKLVEAK